MLLSSLMKLSELKISVRQFREELKTEVGNYKKLLRKKGVSIPIILEEDIDLSSIDIKRLLSVLRTGEFDKYECSYIADALTLSESFSILDEDDAYMIESLVLE